MYEMSKAANMSRSPFAIFPICCATKDLSDILVCGVIGHLGKPSTRVGTIATRRGGV